MITWKTPTCPICDTVLTLCDGGLNFECMVCAWYRLWCQPTHALFSSSDPIYQHATEFIHQAPRTFTVRFYPNGTIEACPFSGVLVRAERELFITDMREDWNTAKKKQYYLFMSCQWQKFDELLGVVLRRGYAEEGCKGPTKHDHART